MSTNNMSLNDSDSLDYDPLPDSVINEAIKTRMKKKLEIGETAQIVDELQAKINELANSVQGGIKKLIDTEASIRNTLKSFTELTRFNESPLVAQEVATTSIVADFEDIFIPKASKYFQSASMFGLDTKECRGCRKLFYVLKGGTIYEPDYYKHCVKECPQYASMNLIRKCDNCQKLFWDCRALKFHSCHQRPKPDWMTDFTYFNSVSTASFTQSMCCPGCQQNFPLAENLKGNFSFDYLIHLIEECEDYKTLNLIAECVECGFKFPTRKSYISHRSMVHEKPEKPDWMPFATYRNSRKAEEFEKSACCPGCERSFVSAVGRKGRMSFDYLVHLIEECEEYKKLNRIHKCTECGFKFPTRRSYKNHRAMKHINV